MSNFWEILALSVVGGYLMSNYIFPKILTVSLALLLVALRIYIERNDDDTIELRMKTFKSKRLRQVQVWVIQRIMHSAGCTKEDVTITKVGE